jgi:hypothetical protein
MDIIDNLNNSKIILGLAALLATVGSKYIRFELDDYCKDLLQKPFIRKLIVFSIVFWGTRDITISILITLIFFILTNGFLKKNKNDLKI